MTQKEKLDIILKKLYEYRHDNRHKPFKPMLKELGVYESDVDMDRLARALKDEYLADVLRISAGLEIKISPKGMDYCEETSHTKPGISLITLNISGNDNQTTVGHNVSNTSQVQNNNSDASLLINQLIKAISESSELSQSNKSSALECIEDIESDIKAGKAVKKFKWDSLLTNTASAAQIVDVATKLAETFGYLPSL